MFIQMSLIKRERWTFSVSLYLNRPAGGALKLHNGVEASLLLVDDEHIYRVVDFVFYRTFVTP